MVDTEYLVDDYYDHGSQQLSGLV